jgi:O-antigen/teichoic acid export membrane protein
LGFLKAGWWGLLAGSLLGMITNLLVQLFHGQRIRTILDSLKESSDKAYSKEVLKTYSDFPKYRLPTTLLNTLSQHLPSIMLVTFFSPAVGGFYSIAMGVVGMPGSLISASIRPVFYQKAATLFNEGRDLFKLALKTTLGLAFVGIIPFGTIIIFGDDLFSFVFGEEWRTAGVYASWLSLWVYCMFCNSPAISLTLVLNIQKQSLIFETIIMSTRIIVIAIGAIIGNPLQTIIMFSVSGAILNILFITMAMFYSIKYEKQGKRR